MWFKISSRLKRQGHETRSEIVQRKRRELQEVDEKTAQAIWAESMMFLAHVAVKISEHRWKMNENQWSLLCERRGQDQDFLRLRSKNIGKMALDSDGPEPHLCLSWALKLPVMFFQSDLKQFLSIYIKRLKDVKRFFLI